MNHLVVVFLSGCFLLHSFVNSGVTVWSYSGPVHILIKALCAASDCGRHVAAAAAAIGTGNETDAGHRGFPTQKVEIMGQGCLQQCYLKLQIRFMYNTNAIKDEG